MNQAIVEELQGMGVVPAQAEAIAEDLAALDGRSLLTELLMRGLWCLVIDETNPALLQKVGGEAVRRLLSMGVDPDDLMDVVRETQVDLIFSVAQLIDWPTYETELEATPELAISVSVEGSGAPALPIHELHSCLLERDPSGRHGGPRTLEVRKFQKLPESERAQLMHLLAQQKFSVAAAIWKKSVGGDLSDCLSAVRTLRDHVRRGA